MKEIHIQMPDGSVWGVPAQIIAHNKATYYSNKENQPPLRRLELYDNELQAALENNADLLDWAANNMNWAHVEPHARCVSHADCDYQEGWVNGAKKVVEV